MSTRTTVICDRCGLVAHIFDAHGWKQLSTVERHDIDFTSFGDNPMPADLCPDCARRALDPPNGERRMTLANRRRLLLLLRDASTITARYQIALDHADECRAGWPTQTIGASPDTSRSTGGGNGIPHDPADHAHRDMRRLLNEITGPAEQLARLVAEWTPERWETHQHTDTAETLAEADGGLWCANHARYGHMETRDHANRRKHCRWCDGIHRDTKILPDRELIERKARMGRVTSRDMEQFRARNPIKKKRKGAA